MKPIQSLKTMTAPAVFSTRTRQDKGRGRVGGFLKTLTCFTVGVFAVSGLAACSHQLSTSSLREGQCFKASRQILVEGRQSPQVQVVPCTRPHNSEVVGVHTLSDGTLSSLKAAPSAGAQANPQESGSVNPEITAPKPEDRSSAIDAEQMDDSQEKVRELAHQAAKLCAADFKEYVGADYQDTDWDIYPLSALRTQGHQTEQAIICVALTLPERSATLRNAGTGGNLN